MTDSNNKSPSGNNGSIHTTEAARKRLVGRYRSEKLFKLVGLSAVLTAVGFLALMLSTIVSGGLPAFTYNYLTVPVDFSEVDRDDPGATDYNLLIRNGLKELFPFVSSRKDRKLRNGLISSGSNILVRNEVIANPELLETSENVQIPLSDFADLYLKGDISEKQLVRTSGVASPTAIEGTVTVYSSKEDFGEIFLTVREEHRKQLNKLRSEFNDKKESLNLVSLRLSELNEQARSGTLTEEEIEEVSNQLDASVDVIDAEVEEIDQRVEKLDDIISTSVAKVALNETMPSFLLQINGGVVKIELASANSVIGKTLVPLESMEDAERGEWRLIKLNVPEPLRKFSDLEVAWTESLNDQELVSTRFNSIFFTAGASREPEMAGIWGAVVGSFLTMLVTLALAFPTGVAAAIYLEELAPRNRLTYLIEVNINNLAAVPSIVFGLLGLAVFLSIFGMPRSAPIVGGMVLALMTLPTIIIASRAALKAVPPSIREAALGIGASKSQTVFNHVLPLAMPGILTGTIIGMAQALGETAPLLMIGMVAFIVDIPGGFFDPATVLPVQIFMWADFPEPAFRQKTSAAIMVLLAFLILMNAVAIILRKKFERRW